MSLGLTNDCLPSVAADLSRISFVSDFGLDLGEEVDGFDGGEVVDVGGGELVEDTFDWYAQHQNGDVWYFGEEVKNYEGGILVDTDGSWAAGVSGARAGVLGQHEQPAVLGQGLLDQTALGQDPGHVGQGVVLPAAMELLAPLKGKRVLDLCCGQGVLIPLLLDKGADTVVGIDASPQLIDAARQRLDAIEVPSESDTALAPPELLVRGRAAWLRSQLGEGDGRPCSRGRR